MSNVLAAPGPYYTDQFLHDDNMGLIDETVAEVYGMMLGLETAVAREASSGKASTGESHTAIVGLSGALRGSCEVRMDSMAARMVTSAMLGNPLGNPLVGEHDASIGDAVGEICNMIAGGWKNRIPSLASACSLSPPTIVYGCNYVVKLGTPCIKFVRVYEFGGQAMQVTLQCEELPRG